MGFLPLCFVSVVVVIFLFLRFFFFLPLGNSPHPCRPVSERKASFRAANASAASAFPPSSSSRQISHGSARGSGSATVIVR